jgi:hypothetical protein
MLDVGSIGYAHPLVSGCCIIVSSIIVAILLLLIVFAILLKQNKRTNERGGYNNLVKTNPEVLVISLINEFGCWWPLAPRFLLNIIRHSGHLTNMNTYAYVFIYNGRLFFGGYFHRIKIRKKRGSASDLPVGGTFTS